MLSSATSVLLVYEPAQRVASNRAFVFAVLFFLCGLHISDRSAPSPVQRRFSLEEEEAERNRDGERGSWRGCWTKEALTECRENP
eukprot:601450-Rhodomonas_salina.2